MAKSWSFEARFAGISALVKDVNEPRAAVLMPNARFPHRDPLGAPIPEHVAAIRVPSDQFENPHGLDNRVYDVKVNGVDTKLILIDFEDVLLDSGASGLKYHLNGEIVATQEALGRSCGISPSLVARPTVASDRVAARVFLSSGTLSAPDPDEVPYRCVKFDHAPARYWAPYVTGTSPQTSGKSRRIHLRSFHGGDDASFDIKPSNGKSGGATPILEILNSMWLELIGYEMPYHADHFRAYYNLCEGGVGDDFRELPIPRESDRCVRTAALAGSGSFCIQPARFDSTNI